MADLMFVLPYTQSLRPLCPTQQHPFLCSKKPLATVGSQSFRTEDWAVPGCERNIASLPSCLDNYVVYTKKTEESMSYFYFLFFSISLVYIILPHISTVFLFLSLSLLLFCYVWNIYFHYILVHSFPRPYITASVIVQLLLPFSIGKST